jgi:hypothetical protein
MAKLLMAFINEAFAQFAKRFMDLLSTPRRRLSVGVDCEPWEESGESILADTPWAIAHAIVEAITRTSRIGVTELFVIPGIDDPTWYDGTLPPKSSSRISREKKAKNRTLSSNLLFGGLYTTPRPCHLMSVRGSMGCALAVSIPGLSLELGALIGPLRAADLGARVKYAAARLGIRPPAVRQQKAYIEWLRTHGVAALPHIRDYPRILRRG